MNKRMRIIDCEAFESTEVYIYITLERYEYWDMSYEV